MLFVSVSELSVHVTYSHGGSYIVTVNGNEHVVNGSLVNLDDKTVLECDIDGVKTSANVLRNGDSLHVFTMVRACKRMSAHSIVPFISE